METHTQPGERKIWSRRPGKKAIIATVRAAFGAVLAFVLIRYTLRFTDTDLSSEFSRAVPVYFIVAFIIHGFALLLLSIRWFLLLRGKRIDISFFEVVRLTFIGGFFDLFIPGPVSGDVAKIFMLWKPSKEKSYIASVTVIVDRLIGLATLVFLSLMAVLVFYLYYDTSGKTHELAIDIVRVMFAILIILPLVILMFYGFLRVSRKRSADFVASLRQKSLLKKIGDGYTKTVDALIEYRNSRSTLLYAVLITIIAHGCFVVNLYLLGLCLGDPNTSLGDAFLANQVGSLLTIIPITPGGLGLRDFGIASILHALHNETSQAGGIAVFMTAIIVFWRMVGGVVLFASLISRRVFETYLGYEGNPPASSE